MITKKELKENVLEAIRRVAHLHTGDLVDRWINQEYFKLCRLHSWHALRTSIQVDFTALADDDDTGLYIPSNVFGIDRVRDNEDDIEFVPRDQADAIQPDESGYRYYVHMPETSEVAYGQDLTLQSGATTFQADSLVTDYSTTDDFIQFGIEPGFYQLTAIKTFEPVYWGPSMNGEAWKIRPETTQKMVILDSAENVLRDRTVDIYYWKAPQPLYRDTDRIVLPIAAPLELAVLIRAVGIVGKRQIAADRYRAEFREALGEAMHLNPANPRSSRPRDHHNNLFDMTQEYFSERGATTQEDLRYIFRRAS